MTTVAAGSERRPRRNLHTTTFDNVRQNGLGGTLACGSCLAVCTGVQNGARMGPPRVRRTHAGRRRLTVAWTAMKRCDR